MDIVITPRSEKPIYQQIEDELKAQILSRQLKPDTLLPSIRQLAIELKISVITVKTAYENLEREGFIYSYPGKGFYVASLSETQLSAIKSAIARQTLENQLEYLDRIGVSSAEILRILKERTED